MATPGPWTVTVHDKWTDVDGPHWTVAGDVSNEDAPLIAAAPDLLSALRDLIADSDDVDDGKLPAISAVALTRARQAVAKASNFSEEMNKEGA